MSQIGAADLVIVTKADLASRADIDALLAAVAQLNPRAALPTSANANLCAGSMLSLLSAGAGAGAGLPPLAAVTSPEHSRNQVHVHSHTHHDAQSLFLALPVSLARADLVTRLAGWIAEHKVGLLRLKGLIRLDDDARVAVQWSIGDANATVAPVDRLIDPQQEARYGLTVILERACYRESRAKLFQAFGCPEPTVTTA